MYKYGKDFFKNANFSRRTINSLIGNNIETIEDLKKIPLHRFGIMKGIGEKSEVEIITFLENLNNDIPQMPFAKIGDIICFYKEIQGFIQATVLACDVECDGDELGTWVYRVKLIYKFEDSQPFETIEWVEIKDILYNLTTREENLKFVKE